jgi:hypothetical protein
MYKRKYHLSDADNEDKIDEKVVNMRKKYKSPESSHNSTETTAAKRQREKLDREAVIRGFANTEQTVRVNVRRKTYLVRRDCVDLVKVLAVHGANVDATWAEDFLDLNQFAAAKSLDNVVYNESLLMLGREKQQQRAESIDRAQTEIHPSREPVDV